jgi:hypothetical protein
MIILKLLVENSDGIIDLTHLTQAKASGMLFLTPNLNFAFYTTVEISCGSEQLIGSQIEFISVEQVNYIKH